MERELREIVAATARIEERTSAILSEQKALNERLTRHEDDDREDFKEVHHRVSRTERKVNWILGIGSGIVFLISLVATYYKVIGTAVAAMFGV